MYIKAEFFKLMKSNRFYGLIAFTVYEFIAMIVMVSKVNAPTLLFPHFVLTFTIPFLLLIIIPKGTIDELNRNTNKLLFTLDFSKKKWLLTNILFINGIALYMLLVSNIVNFSLIIAYSPNIRANETNFYIVNSVLIMSWILFSANLFTLIQMTYRKLSKGYKTLINVLLTFFGIIVYSNMIGMYFSLITNYYNNMSTNLILNFVVPVIILIAATIGIIIAKLYLYSSQDV